MSLRAPVGYCIPDETARVAHAAFPKGNRCSLYSPWIIRPSSPDRLTTSAVWLSLLLSSCRVEDIYKERRWLEILAR